LSEDAGQKESIMKNNVFQWFFQFAVLLNLGISVASGAAESVTVDSRRGGLVGFSVPEGTQTFSATGGGFTLRDAVNKMPIALPDGSLSEQGNKTEFTCRKNGDLLLKASFTPGQGYILVTGEVVNLLQKDRGVILDYCVPVFGGNVTFSGDLNSNVIHSADMKESESSLYPVAAMCGEKAAVAMAIPPMDPRFFGAVANADGLVMRFYLGMTPETKQFPDRASFSFIIYPVDREWGFRDALSRYYRFYPDYYTRRVRPGELILGLLGTNEWPDMEHYAFNRVGLGRSAQLEMARDTKHNILSLGNMNVGTAEITGLPGKPANEAEAEAIYREQCESTDEEHEMGGPNPGIAELVRSSACKNPNGSYVLSVRYTQLGNGIAFKTNPNPGLYGDRMTCQGKKWLLAMDDWISKFPLIDGAFVDSLGANWPAVLNYNREHFKYARLPLTFDPKGRVALANSLSHYEFLDALRTKLRATNRYLTGNGVYAYISGRTAPEHPRDGRVWIDRFFIASLLDMATSEGGVRSGLPRIRNARVNMGPKVYCLLNREWPEQTVDEMKDWFNQTLVYGVIANNTLYYEPDGGKSYYPETYERDKDLIAWFMPKVTLLAASGWEPVTCAGTDDRTVLLERFDRGDAVYFTVLSEAAEPKTCALTIDTKALGFGNKFSIEEISGQSSLENKGNGKILLKLTPKRTAIIALKKTS
jgi:hypothetical protein